jgi:CBS domain-containing protein
MRIDRLHGVTSPRLAVVDVDATLHAAAISLSKPGIGLAVVCHGDSCVVGVLSKADLVRHLASSGRLEASVAELMSRPVISCSPGDDLHEVWQMMTAQNLENMPVLDADLRPLGILNIRDAMKVLFEEEEFLEHALVNYISGVGYQ